jgi:hypothetical protein
MSRQLRSPIPKALLISVVCWATLLFTCIGASSSVNALAIIYEALGAAAVASAIYLILEFSQPYLGSGLIDQSQKATAAAIQIADK